MFLHLWEILQIIFPGAPGVGPKTAMKLISEYGSIEELFKNTDKLKGKT